MATPRPTTALEEQTYPFPSVHGGSHDRVGTDPIPDAYYGGPLATVTQITSITTSVSINARRGQITTVSQTIAAGAEASFTVSNSYVHAADVVVVNLKSTSSTGGPFLCYVSAVADGSFVISITNPSAATAGNNTLVISFVLLSQEA